VARWALRIGVPILILVVLLFGARWYLDRQWYVAPSDGHVAIFQGVPLTLLGYELGHPVEHFPGLLVAEVRQLAGFENFDQAITFSDRDEALDEIQLIRDELETARRAERQEQRQQNQGGGGG
jgi:hypothetical protein